MVRKEVRSFLQALRTADFLKNVRLFRNRYPHFNPKVQINRCFLRTFFFLFIRACFLFHVSWSLLFQYRESCLRLINYFTSLFYYSSRSSLSNRSLSTTKPRRCIVLKDADDEEHKDKDNTNTKDNSQNHPFGLSTLLRVQLQPCPFLAQPRDIRIQRLICIIK